MIRKAETGDLPEILKIYDKARQFMAEHGNPSQWGSHYPSIELLQEDIEQGNLYVLDGAKGLCGVFAFLVGEEETYVHIEQGNWLSGEAYGTIHRVAGDGSVHGLMEQIVGFCRGRIRHLRIDTHPDNRIMQHLILKNGFQKCGIIYVKDGTARIAYESL